MAPARPTRVWLLAGALLAGVLLLSGCVCREAGDHAADSVCAGRRPDHIRTELYFGLSKPSGGVVTKQEWEQFLAAEVTPRFRDGLTVVDADGQYLNQAGRVVQEKTKLVILIYPEDARKEKAVTELIGRYKELFKQESVLRVRQRAQVSF